MSQESSSAFLSELLEIVAEGDAASGRSPTVYE